MSFIVSFVLKITGSRVGISSWLFCFLLFYFKTNSYSILFIFVSCTIITTLKNVNIGYSCKRNISLVMLILFWSYLVSHKSCVHRIQASNNKTIKRLYLELLIKCSWFICVMIQIIAWKKPAMIHNPKIVVLFGIFVNTLHTKFCSDPNLANCLQYLLKILFKISSSK